MPGVLERLDGLALGPLTTWGLIRAAGLVSYLLLWGAVVSGLWVSGRQAAGRPVPLVAAVHEASARWALWVGLFHAGLLLYDRYVPFRPVDLLWPLGGPYRPVPTALGALAAWWLLALLLAFDLRRRLHPRIWQRLHAAALPLYAVATLHGLLAGTDTPLPGVRLMYQGTAGVVLLLSAARLRTLGWAHRRSGGRAERRVEVAGPGGRG